MNNRLFAEQVWWYVARSGGLVALALSGASVLWGLLLSTRYLERVVRPKWLLDLHKLLGAFTVIFTVIHVAALMLDSYVAFGLVDVLVPFASSSRPGAVAWGARELQNGLDLVTFSSLSVRQAHVWRTLDTRGGQSPELPACLMATVRSYCLLGGSRFTSILRSEVST